MSPAPVCDECHAEYVWIRGQWFPACDCGWVNGEDDDDPDDYADGSDGMVVA